VNTFQTIICMSAMCALGSAAPADVVLTSGEAYIDGFALIGIDERIEWDGTGSAFSALIDEEATQTTGNLDRKSGTEALDILTGLCSEIGAGMLMVTHSEVAASYCSIRYTLEDGKLRLAS